MLTGCLIWEPGRKKCFCVDATIRPQASYTLTRLLVSDHSTVWDQFCHILQEQSKCDYNPLRIGLLGHLSWTTTSEPQILLTFYCRQLYFSHARKINQYYARVNLDIQVVTHLSFHSLWGLGRLHACAQNHYPTINALTTFRLQDAAGFASAGGKRLAVLAVLERTMWPIF